MFDANINALQRMARKKSWRPLLDFAVSGETDGVDVYLGTGGSLVPAVTVMLKCDNPKASGRWLPHADDGRIVEDRCVLHNSASPRNKLVLILPHRSGTRR